MAIRDKGRAEQWRRTREEGMSPGRVERILRRGACCCPQTVNQYLAYLLMMFEKIVVLSLEKPAGHHVLEDTQDQMAQNVDVGILPNDALALSFCQDIHHLTHRLLEEIVCLCFDETFAYPHFE